MSTDKKRAAPPHVRRAARALLLDILEERIKTVAHDLRAQGDPSRGLLRSEHERIGMVTVLETFRLLKAGIERDVIADARSSRRR